MTNLAFYGTVQHALLTLRAVTLGVLLMAFSHGSIASGLLFTDDYVLDGYDVVSYFSDAGPQKGNTDYGMRYDKKIYAFSNLENATKFAENPEKYLPQYDGNCAYGMVYGTESSVDPLVYNIVGDKIFFMINHGTQKRWKKRAPYYIKRSDRAWKKLSSAENMHRK